MVSICATNFAPIVEALSDASIVLQTEFVLHDPPVGAAITVTIDGETATTGWVLDPAIPAIVFEVPPPAGAEVQVTYTVQVEDG